MKIPFIADGWQKLRTSPEMLARERALKESIRSRYAEEMAGAGFFRRWVLKVKVALEFRRERRQHEPSDQTLFVQRV